MAHIDIARRSTRGTAVLFFGRIGSTGVSAVASIIITRLLSPAEFGLLTLILLIPGIVGLFTGFGLDTAIIRYAALNISKGDAGTAKRMAVNALVFLVVSGVALTIISFLLATYLSSTILHREGISSLVQLASLVILGSLLLQVGNSLFMGWGSMGLVSITGVAQSALKLLIAPTLILVGLGVYGALLGHVLSFLISGVLALVLVYALWLRRIPSTLGGFVRDIRAMASYGLPLYVGAIVSGFAGQYITVILAAIASNSVVGYYQAGANLAVPISLVSTVITITLLPGFAGLQGIDADLSLAFRYATRYVAYIAMPVIVFVAAGAEPLTLVLLTSAYSSSIVYVRLIALASLPIVIGLTITPSFLNGIGKTRITFVLNALSAATILIFALLFSTGFGLGVYGLIYAIAASNLITAVVGLILLSKLFKAGIDVRRISLLLVASLIAYGSVYLVGLATLPDLATLFIDVLVFGAVYLTLVPLVHALDKADLVRLRVASEGLGQLGKLINLFLTYENLLLRARD